MEEAASVNRSRSGISTVIAMTIMVMLSSAAALVWSAYTQYHLREGYHFGLALSSAQSAARHVTMQLNVMRRDISLFAEEQQDVFTALADKPDDAVARNRIDRLLRSHFPDHYAHSLATPDGTLLLDDFGESIGDLCRKDIHEFAASGRVSQSIHPGPGIYHFDLMVPWRVGKEQRIFFLSFKADILARLLASTRLPEEKLLLTLDGQPDLIEVTTEGSRDRLLSANRLTAEEMDLVTRFGARVDIPDTRWQVVSLPERSLLEELRRGYLLQIGTSLVLVLLVGGSFIAALLWYDRRRLIYTMKERLAAAVFRNAQEGITITDLDGRIVATNPAFTNITEYTEAEVLGKRPNMLQSGRHDQDFYRGLWHELKETGSWQGEIWNRRKGGEVYLEWLSISTVHDGSGKPTNYVAVYTDISRIRHARSHLEHLAHYDALTDLPNRLLLYSRLEHALGRAHRSGSRVAVLFIDLDRFKRVNDEHGHAAGDELLQLFSRRIGVRLREADTFARLGGDEFVVVLEEMLDCAEPGSLAADLIALANEPFILKNGVSANVGASIGISLYPTDGEEAEILLKRADSALYQAKQAGRNSYRYYN